MNAGRVSLGSIIVRLLICGLVLCGLLAGAQASVLRVRSMGGLSICVRDLDGDPVAFNPARATLIKRPTVDIGGAGYCSGSKSRTDSSQIVGGVTSGNWSRGQYSNEMLKYDLLGYFPLRDSLVTGLHVFGSNSKTDSLQVSGNFTAANTYMTSTQQTSDTPNLVLDLLAAKRFAPMSAGLQALYHAPATSHSGTKSSAVNDGYYGPPNYDRFSVAETETVTTYLYDIKAGVLLSPWDRSSLDITINPVAYDTTSRQTVNITNNVDVWTDNLNTYPRSAYKTRSITGQATLRYDVSPRFNYGFQVRCIPNSSSSEMQRSTYTYTTEKMDGLSYVLGGGIDFKTSRSFEAGLELLYYNNYRQYHDYTWGNVTSAGEIFAYETTDDRWEIRLGMEQWVVENKLALRLGGLKYIYNGSNSRRTYTAQNGIATGEYSYYYSWMDLFSAGFEWVLTKDFSLEYGFIATSPSYAQHEVNLRFLF